jgi:hypothetical protein
MMLRMFYFFYRFLTILQSQTLMIIIGVRLIGLLFVSIVVTNLSFYLLSMFKQNYFYYLLIFILLEVFVLFFIDFLPRFIRKRFDPLFFWGIDGSGIEYLRGEVSIIHRFLQVIYYEGGTFPRSIKINNQVNAVYDKYYVVRSQLLTSLVKRNYLLTEIKYKPSFVLYKTAMLYYVFVSGDQIIVNGRIGEKFFKKEEDRQRAGKIWRQELVRQKRILEFFWENDIYLENGSFTVLLFEDNDLMDKKFHENMEIKYSTTTYEEIVFPKFMDSNRFADMYLKWTIKDKEYKKEDNFVSNVKRVNRIIRYCKSSQYKIEKDFLNRKLEEDIDDELDCLLHNYEWEFRNEEGKQIALKWRENFSREYQWYFDEIINYRKEWMRLNLSEEKIKVLEEQIKKEYLEFLDKKKESNDK